MFTPISLKINCGYARTAIYELTGCDKTQVTNAKVAERSRGFQELFTKFQFPANFFTNRENGRSIFDENCHTIMTFFSKKWNKLSKSEYTSMFSTIKWKGMAEAEQLQHSLSYCNCCSRNHQHLQPAFPGKPMYTAPPAFVTLSGEQTCTKRAERSVLRELNQLWEEKYDHIFTNALPSLTPEEDLVEKKSKDREKKRIPENEKKARATHK